jgi:hypothetical protein
MLKRLLDWNRRRRQWNRNHVSAWAGQDVPGASGLSVFQEKCEAAVGALLKTRGLALRDRRIIEGGPLATPGSPDSCVHARLADEPWEIWIHRDQAQLTGAGSASANLEQWDAPTPDQLVREFLDRIARALDESKGAGARLQRYWFVGDAEDPFGVTGIGVTAFTEEDARGLIRRALPALPEQALAPWRAWSLDRLSCARVVENVDVRVLDQGHVIPNMGLVVDRGVWWPKLSPPASGKER